MATSGFDGSHLAKCLARHGAFFVSPRRDRLYLHASTPFQETRIREPATMSFARSAVVAVAILGLIMLGGGLAQTTTSSSSTSSIVDDVSEWTSKQWNRAKGEWTKEKEKWADCRKQSNDQNLTGLKSWSFLASCMTSRATAGRSSKRTSSSILSRGTACWDRLAAAAQLVGVTLACGERYRNEGGK